MYISAPLGSRAPRNSNLQISFYITSPYLYFKKYFSNKKTTLRAEFLPHGVVIVVAFAELRPPLKDRGLRSGQGAERLRNRGGHQPRTGCVTHACCSCE